MTFRSTFTRAVRTPVLPVVLGVALTATLASGFAWSATGKTAVLTVDGQSREVDFRGGTVADVLEAAGLSAGEHDLLVPAVGSAVDDGATVALRRGRQLELVVDGRPRTVWVTAASVEEALQQVGLREQGLALSASRSRSIPLDGLTLRVTTPKTIRIHADGGSERRTTAAASVRDALIEAGVHLDGDDRLSHPRALALSDGLQVRVTRIRTERAVETVPVPFETERRSDGDLFTGETTVLQAGETGSARRTVERVYADGALEKRTVVRTEVLRAAVKRIVAVGTKARPAPAQRTSSSTGGGADGLNWPALARCESGGNPRAVSSTGKYRGLYQFSLATWRSVGGQGDPIDNSAGEQTYRAKLLYNRSGAGQWPHCGKYLFT